MAVGLTSELAEQVGWTFPAFSLQVGTVNAPYPPFLLPSPHLSTPPPHISPRTHVILNLFDDVDADGSGDDDGGSSSSFLFAGFERKRT